MGAWDPAPSKIETERMDQVDVGLAQVGIDLGREEIVNISARPVNRLRIRFVAIDDVIGRVLIRPSRPKTVLMEHAKDGVGANEIMRP